jgi:pimeloyl-ACP methyl ester carboxylesterase
MGCPSPLADEELPMQSVTSRDGTTIAFDRLGDGPPVVLVCGGSTDRTANAALAAELATDLTVHTGDYRIPAERAKAVAMPTIVIAGGASLGFMGPAADALAALIPDARRRTLGGQDHNVNPTVLGLVLKEFFTG